MIRRRLPFFVVAALLTLALLSPSLVAAEKINWQTNYTAALEQAKKDGKPLLVKVGAKWCRYCVLMKQRTFADSHITEHINDCFVPVSIDADAQKRFVQSMGIRSLPTTLIISPERKVLSRIAGYQSPTQLDSQLERVCSKH